jgi:signal transduction histidine kinase
LFVRRDNLYSSEAVIVLKDGEVLYCDPAAAKVFPDSENINLETVFDGPVPETDEEPVTKEITVDGVPVLISAVTQNGYTVVTLRMADSVGEQALSAIEAASGEMRNLLSVMKMASGLMFQHFEGVSGAKVDKYTAMLTHSYFILLRLTNNLSDFGSYLRGSYHLNCAFFDMAMLVKELADSLNTVLQGKDITVDVIGGDKPILIFADREKIIKLILNLVSNAVAGIGDRGTITLSVSSNKERVVFSVADNGRGLSEEEIATVWNRYLAHGSGVGRRGVGLGMTIVQMIARQHGGSVVLESQAGVGTKVTVSLPLFAHEDTSLSTEITVYESSGISPLLTELAGVLHYSKYDHRLLD